MTNKGTTSLEVTQTDEGWEVIDFLDWDGQPSSLQQDSVVNFDYADSIKRPGTGCIRLGLNRERMRLNREQARQIGEFLIVWAETGSLKSRV